MTHWIVRQQCLMVAQVLGIVGVISGEAQTFLTFVKREVFRSLSAMATCRTSTVDVFVSARGIAKWVPCLRDLAITGCEWRGFRTAIARKCAPFNFIHRAHVLQRWVAVIDFDRE